MSTTANGLEAAIGLLAVFGEAPARPEPNRVDVPVEAAQLLAAAGALVAAQWGYLAAITGLDGGPKTGVVEVLYHFCSGPNVVTLRVSVPRSAPAVPSLCGLVPSAGLYERELAEMLGVSIENSPNTAPLYLPEDWPGDLYPLRKDADLAPITQHPN